MDKKYCHTFYLVNEDSPLVKAKDAIEIDNSFLTIEEQLDTLLKLANKIISQ